MKVCCHEEEEEKEGDNGGLRRRRREEKEDKEAFSCSSVSFLLLLFPLPFRIILTPSR